MTEETGKKPRKRHKATLTLVDKNHAPSEAPKRGAPIHTKHGLTEKQMRFAERVALDGLSYAEAWRLSYNDRGGKQTTHWRNAATVAHNPKVKAYINELLAEKKEEDSVRRSTRGARAIAIFESIAADEDQSPNTRLRAAELMAKASDAFVQEVKDGKDGTMTLKEMERQLADLLNRGGDR